MILRYKKVFFYNFLINYKTESFKKFSNTSYVCKLRELSFKNS